MDPAQSSGLGGCVFVTGSKKKEKKYLMQVFHARASCRPTHASVEAVYKPLAADAASVQVVRLNVEIANELFCSEQKRDT